jgi:hypothetical protein
MIYPFSIFLKLIKYKLILNLYLLSLSNIVFNTPVTIITTTYKILKIITNFSVLLRFQIHLIVYKL